jgi:hypothetical protein
MNEDMLHNGALPDEARAAVTPRFVIDDGTIRAGTQTSSILALHLDSFPENLRDLAAAERVRNIRERYNHLSTSLVGPP